MSFRSFLRSALIIVTITAILDLTITYLFRQQIHDLLTDDAQRASERAYRYDVPYHHELRPSLDTERRWGTLTYRHVTDGHGLRSGTCGGEDLTVQYHMPKDSFTYFLVGDSFTEGLGYDYEKVWAGRFACLVRQQGRRAFNLGVMSYSPSIFLKKVERFQVESEISPDHLVVFLDISDIEDEGRVYRTEPDGRIVMASKPLGLAQVGGNLQYNLTSLNVMGRVIDGFLGPAIGDLENSIGRERARWTVDDRLYAEYGEKGLTTAARNLARLAGYCKQQGCRMTLVVYPWPDQIFAGDRDSIQVTYWQAWSARNGVDFLNLFPAFFEEEAEATIRRYFIPGDIHWNVEGNALIYRKLGEHLGLL